ncbi:MAG TPA: DUF1667 domain-containing protein [Candidatus Hydrogenedens sp.]|nr:DUF1667 domain-containing protein [Candidatus Hydrogenedens sp.]HOK08753.1 DUF1667 domain-containing protein [Candidatus Hydrogenedens sp.]HOL20987.1 DUF1667 domain-containing protein [Candidatus Hydrogenedens sp.]HPP57561.1 DUF1667 domain-containing protein [Candidatus Hydrogenedens sp.]
MEQEIICLSCPNGCHIQVREVKPGTYSYQGAKCERGEIYAYEEITDPKRIVTAVIATNSDEMPYIPVKTDKPIPKKFIKPLLKKLYTQKVDIPVSAGKIIIENFENTGVNVVITRSFPIHSS